MRSASLSTLLLTTLAPLLPAAPSFDPLQRIFLSAGAGEIVSYSNDVMAVTHNPNGGVQLFTHDGTQFNSSVTVDFSTYFTNNAVSGFTFDEVSSVALDPAGRGFGVAALLNGSTSSGNNNQLAGRLGVFDISTGTVLGSFEAGFHPDQVGFNSDGTWLSVANEGEIQLHNDGLGDNPGSISIMDLSSIADGAGVMSSGTLETYGFESANTETAFQTAAANARSHHTSTAATYEQFLEPEYTAFDSSGNILVSLQENNAVAHFNPTTKKWTNLTNLGIHQIDIDPNDKDGVANTGTLVYGAPMPDTISSFSAGGKSYLVTANEGDAHPDDEDSKDPDEFTSLPNDPNGQPYVMGDNSNPSDVDRLDLVVNLSDPDGDDNVDQLVSFGTRDVTIWEIQADGTLSKVSSVDMEEYLLSVDPTRHNASDGGDPGEMDKRSDNKGPEPEAVATYVAPDGRVFLVAAAERQNGLVLIDATDPANPQAVAYLNDHNENLLSPESVVITEIGGDVVALVGYEAFDINSGGIGVYRLQGVPEPSTGLLALLASAALLRRRR